IKSPEYSGLTRLYVAGGSICESRVSSRSRVELSPSGPIQPEHPMRREPTSQQQRQLGQVTVPAAFVRSRLRHRNLRLKWNRQQQDPSIILAGQQPPRCITPVPQSTSRQLDDQWITS